MPTITVQREDLYQLAGLDRSFSLALLEDRLALVKGELNNRTLDGYSLRTADGGWVADDENYALRIELKDTNRPDLWCVEGIARQLRNHACGQGSAYPFFTRDPSLATIEVDPRLQTYRPFVTGFLARGGLIDEEALRAFIEAQETLTFNFGRRRKTVSIGLYSGDQLTFPVQYKAIGRDEIRFEPLAPPLDPAWPSGVAMTPAEILDRHPTGREYSWILEEWELVPVLTDATGQVLSLPPIINSADLGRVTPGMSALFVEVTGTELDHCLLAINILATNLADRGWTITPVTTHYPYDTPHGRAVTAPHALPLTQHVSVTEFERLLGEQISTADIVEKLTAYGVSASATGEQITATISSYRQDYLHAVDVIEDYAISRGYATFTPNMPADFTVGKLNLLTEREDLVRDLMIGFGFEEAICNILTNLENLRQRMELGSSANEQTEPFHGGQTVAIANVMNRNYAHLRDWLLPSLLEIEAHSVGALYPHRVFEVGEVAVYDLTQNLGSRTEARLAGIIAEEDASFDSAQSVLYALLTSLGVPFRIEPWAHPSFIPGRVAVVVLDAGQRRDASAEPFTLGFLGELSPQVLTNWGARVPIVAFELSIDMLI